MNCRCSCSFGLRLATTAGFAPFLHVSLCPSVRCIIFLEISTCVVPCCRPPVFAGRVRLIRRKNPPSRVSALSRFPRMCWSFAAMSRSDQLPPWHDAAPLLDVTRGDGGPGHSLPAQYGSRAHGASSRAVLPTPEVSLSLALPCAQARRLGASILAERGRRSHRPGGQVSPPGSTGSHPSLSRPLRSACLSPSPEESEESFCPHCPSLPVRPRSRRSRAAFCLAELDELSVTLSCRFALDIWTITQQVDPSADMESAAASDSLVLLSLGTPWELDRLHAPVRVDVPERSRAKFLRPAARSSSSVSTM